MIDAALYLSVGGLMLDRAERAAGISRFVSSALGALFGFAGLAQAATDIIGKVLP